MRRTNFRTRGKNGDLVTWVSNIKNELSEEAADGIVRDLKGKGPYWTGQFEEAWRVELGNVDIPATEDRFLTDKEALELGPLPRRITPTPIPKAKGRKSITYSIGNITTYRDIALDLVPGRIKGGGNETADQDWYETYLNTELPGALGEAVERTAQQSELKNYKGKI